MPPRHTREGQRPRKARGAPMPDSFEREPLMYQGASDHFMGPRDAVTLRGMLEKLDEQ